MLLKSELLDIAMCSVRLLLVFCLALYLEAPIARAISDDFDLDFRGRPLPPDNLLFCDRSDIPFPIELDTRTIPDTDGVPPPFRPMPSRFRFPSSIINLSPQVQQLLLNFLGPDINMTIQRISPPTPTTPIVNPCDISDAETQQDNNQMNPTEIACLVNDTIVSRLGPAFFTTDDKEQIQIAHRGLNCYVNRAWQDAGVNFFPRWFVSSNCVRRDCAVPDQRGMFCQPDLSAEVTTRIIALRWDCCFSYNPTFRRYQYDCGWRRVSFGLVCDCDCACDT